MTNVLLKRGNLHTDIHIGKTPYEQEDRNWGDASTDKGMPKIARKPSASSGELYISLY